MRTLVVGSRGSKLALRQTHWVTERLTALHDGVAFEIKVIKTEGDRAQNGPLVGTGDRGVFVKEIELALLAGEIDLAVHSAKDLPSVTDERLVVAAYPERGNPADVLVSRAGTLSELHEGARVGTSSVRRRAQLLHFRGNLNVIDLRGNLDTRLAKLDDGRYDAVVLAAAGLSRMGLSDRAKELISFDIMLPAVGQGALAVQCRDGDGMCAMLEGVDHCETRACVVVERAFSEGLHAGCQTPVGALARVEGGIVRLDAVVASLDGATVIRHCETGDVSEPETLGKRVADWFLSSPASELLDEARRQTGPAAMGAA